MKQLPIGVFDSGVGGVTVLKRLLEVLPGEDYIYFGDTLRNPYGDRSSEEIKKFTGQIINFMKEKKVKALVIACNTICATINKEEYDFIFFDVLEAGAQSAVDATKNKKVGVIATKRTIESNSYQKKITEIDRDIEVYQQACPELAPLVEKGLYSSPVAYEAANRCLEGLKYIDIDTLVLGCTHYPLLTPIIEKIMGENVKIVDPAIKLSYDVKNYLLREDLINPRDKGKMEFYVSGSKDNFTKTAEMLLERKISEVFVVDIEKY
ncbi:MAG TPA: glutamate racemase [Clostridia bacterium]|nr:glutamate racemase [Clostridia bacterium]